MPVLTDGELTQPTTVGASPASPNGSIPARPGQTITLRSRMTDEYVAGSGSVWYAQYLRSLPFPIDELTADFGDDLYERMLLDPQCGADVMRLKAAILEDGLQLRSAVSDEDEDGYDRAGQICDDLTAMLEDLPTPVDDVLWNLLDGIALGNRVAEQSYTFQTVNGRRWLALTSLKVKPRRTTSFVVDAYGNVKGLLGILPTGFSPVMVGSVLSDLDKQPNLILRDKFAVFTFRPKDNDPRGTSIVRPAYKPWWIKQQVIGEYLKFLTQFVSPSVIGFTPEATQYNAAAQGVPVTDPLGNVVLNPDTGQPLLTTAEQAMLDALKAWRNGTAAAFRGGSKVELIQSKGNGAAFSDALQWCNREIGKAITTQVLATEEGSGQSRAASEVHQDQLDTLVRQGKHGVIRMVEHDILRPLVKYQYGEDAMRKLTPRATLGDTEAYDFAKDGATVAHLYGVGFIGASQLAKLDQRLGLPERDSEFDAQHAQIITNATPERARAVEGEAPESQAAAAAGLIQEAGQPVKQVAA